MPKILVIDDSQGVRRLVGKTLGGEGTEILEAADGESGLNTILENQPDVVLLDLVLPGADGFDVLSTIRANESTRDLPVIMLTASNEMDDLVQGLEGGADDYISKPFNPRELKARVRAMLRIKLLQDQLKEKQRELERISITDELTGLLNRRFYNLRLAEEWAKSSRHRVPLTVAILDLDRFKNVNDNYGHPAGDKVLAGTAAVLAESIRTGDILARYGGEEFALLLPMTGHDAGMATLERIRRRVERQSYDLGNGALLRVTLSAGLAAAPEDRAEDAASFVNLADQRLYRAKEEGRNRVVGQDEAPPRAAES